MKRTAFLVVLLAVMLVACGGPAKLTDAQRVWCGAHPLAVVNAATSLGIAPSAFVQHKAEVEQAELEGDTARATSLILQGVSQQMTATVQDPHPNLTSAQSWEADAPADYTRACIAAEAAK